MKKIILSTLMLALVSLGCSHHKIKLDENQSKGQLGNIASMWMSMIKDKGSRFDATLHIKNDSKEVIIILLHDLECSRGEHIGTLKHTFFNTGERTIDFAPDQEKSFNVECGFAGKYTEGAFKITARKVYNNPSSDRATIGKQIGKDLSTSYSASDESKSEMPSTADKTSNGKKDGAEKE